MDEKKNAKLLQKKLNRVKINNRNKTYIRDLKTNNPCVDCGNFFHYCQMDYDHIGDDKIVGIGALAGYGKSIESIDKEIAKCELVCANCHRLRTWNRLQQKGC